MAKQSNLAIAEPFSPSSAAMEKKERGKVAAMDSLVVAKVLSGIVVQQSVRDLAHTVFSSLRTFVEFEVVALVMRHEFDDSAGLVDLYFLGQGYRKKLDGVQRSLLPTMSGFDASPRVVHGLDCLEGWLPEAMPILDERGIRSCCIAPIAIADRRIGTLILCSVRQGDSLGSAAWAVESVATHIAVAMERIASAQESDRKQRELADSHKHLLMVQRVTEEIISELDLHELLYKIFGTIRDTFGIEYSDILIYDSENNVMVREVVGLHGKREGIREPMCNSPAHISFATRGVVTSNASKFRAYSKEVEQIRLLMKEGIREGCSIPLVTKGRCLGVLNLCSAREGKFDRDCIRIMKDVAKSIAMAVDNALAYRDLSVMKGKLAREKEYLEKEIRVSCRLDNFIGESAAIKKVFEQIETVADSDANVLIVGETGTGKELVARALHQLSGRKDATFVKLNCAAIPSELLESELFGYEKGAFTGATAPRMGLVELAHKGTLFLDEVGDIPVALQPKLLRVLQERQLSRVGSNRMIDVDFRLVSATNRNLQQMVLDHEFRSDLYYRLNVFPIGVPPLRERRDDIPLLVRHFVQKYAQARKRKIERIPSDVMQALVRWPWPGNVRELQNFIERSVILSKGPELSVPIADIQGTRLLSSTAGEQTVDFPNQDLSSEDLGYRERILQALKECHGTVAGPRGAAARLGMKRTTLLYKMQQFGIKAHREFR